MKNMNLLMGWSILALGVGMLVSVAIHREHRLRMDRIENTLTNLVR